MRVYLMYGLILVAMAISTRRWIVGVCGVIVLSALSQHEDMPRAIAGVTGLSPANLLLGWTLLMFALQARTIPSAPRSLPRFGVFLLVMYAAAITLAYARGVIDLGALKGPAGATDLASFTGFTIEFLINPFKVLLPAVLIYLGLRTERDFSLIFAALGVMAFLLAFVTLRSMPLGTLFDESAFMARRVRIQRQTGLNANDLALIMVQASWATALYLRRQKRNTPWFVAAVCLVMFLLSLALCQSRGGFLAFVVTGLVLGVTCWKRLLLGLPVLLILVGATVPTIRDRVMMGIGVQGVAYSEADELDEISAGRTTGLWVPALSQIGKAPLSGAGRLTILRTPMFDQIEEKTGDPCPTHPHNAYLEMLCDGGFPSLVVFLTGMVSLAILACSMSRRKPQPGVAFLGGLGIVAVVPLMVMGLTGQSFWPRENVFPAACLVAILLRAWTLQRPSSRRSVLVNVSR